MNINCQKVTTFDNFGIFLKPYKFFEHRMIKGLNKIGLLSFRDVDAGKEVFYCEYKL